MSTNRALGLIASQMLALEGRAAKAEAEVERLQAKVARVQAYADELRAKGAHGAQRAIWIEAALQDPVQR